MQIINFLTFQKMESKLRWLDVDGEIIQTSITIKLCQNLEYSPLNSK